MILKYVFYVIRHKWFVFLECWRMGIGWRGVIHDLSKFRLDELVPYARFFYGPKAKNPRNETGYYKPTDTGDSAFDFAWLLHQKRNRHHWQFWVLPEDNGGEKIMEIPRVYVYEMVCDWVGASLAQGHGQDVIPWYTKNKDKMRLHPRTRELVESLLGMGKPPGVIR